MILSKNYVYKSRIDSRVSQVVIYQISPMKVYYTATYVYGNQTFHHSYSKYKKDFINSFKINWHKSIQKVL